jgi:hypothetical protein
MEKYKTETGTLKENLQERFNITYQRSIREFSEISVKDLVNKGKGAS